MSSLNSAVEAIYNKVQNDLSSASPEDLAYLGTALEKIGGRATVYDVMKIGDEKIAQILQTATDAINSVNTDIGDIQNTVDNIIITATNNLENSVNDKSTVLTAHINNSINNAQTQIDTIVNDATDSIQAISDVVTSASEQLTEAANIANQQAINGSRFNLALYSTLFK